MKLVLYYANWCSHCKTYLNEWEKIKKNLDIECIEYEDTHSKNEIINAKIEYYPTVKFFDSNEISHQLDDISYDNINLFLKNISIKKKSNNNIYLIILIILSIIYIYIKYV